MKTLLTFAILVLAAAAQAQEPDTSEWLCEFCPFQDGHTGDYSVGASNVSDDSAYFGSYSGYDEQGTYANVDGDGSYASDGYRMRWHLEDIALDSRAAQLEGGSQGSWDYNLGYSEIPYHRYFTSATIFAGTSGELTLPPGWVPAGTTAGFTALDASLVPRAIESERRVVDIGGRYLPTRRVTTSIDYRRQEHDGLKMRGGSSYTSASLLPMPFDYVTDEVDIGLRYDGDASFVSLGWYLSDFQNSNPGLTWQTPFLASPGANSSEMAQAPANRFQQLRMAAGYSLPEARTVMSVSAAVGNIEQNAALLPYTSNASLAVDPLPRSRLDGDVDTTSIAASITSRVIDKTRIRLSYRYDERDNRTPQAQWNRVITDTFVSGELETNLPYSYERSELSLSADYDLFNNLRLSAGYERRELDRDLQEVASQSEDTGWGRVLFEPAATVSIDLRGGASKRDINAYDETYAGSLGQNPLLRKYNLAYRYREFADTVITWSPGEAPLSFALNVLYADDTYSQSLLGLTEGEELSAALDVSWALSEKGSIYASYGVDDLESMQLGSEQFATADWVANYDDSFATVSAGFRMREIAGKFDLRLDYSRSDGASQIDIASAAGGPDAFPDLDSCITYLRLQLGWEQSERMSWNVDYRYQQIDSADWMLEGVAPDTIPTVLSLGATPYDDSSNIIAVSFSYRFAASR